MHAEREGRDFVILLGSNGMQEILRIKMATEGRAAEKVDEFNAAVNEQLQDMADSLANMQSELDQLKDALL